MTTGDAVDLIQEELGEEGHDGPPRNKPLPAGSGLMGKKDSVETLTVADLERLLSDALSGDGNDSVWAYKWDDERVVVGTFRRAKFVKGDWGLFNQLGVAEMVDDYESLFKDLHNGDLTLVSPPSVVAPEPSDSHEEPLPSVQPLSRRDSIATQIYIAKMTKGVSYQIRFEDAVEEADLLIAQLDKEVV